MNTLNEKNSCYMIPTYSIIITHPIVSFSFLNYLTFPTLPISLSNKQFNTPIRYFHSLQFDSGTNFSKKHSFRGIHDFSFFSFFFVTTNPSRSCGYEHVATSSSHVFMIQNHGSDCGIITCSGTNRHFPQNGFWHRIHFSPLYFKINRGSRTSGSMKRFASCASTSLECEEGK